MISAQDLISIGIIRRTHYKDLPPFVFVLRDGLFVPYRSENISELIGLEGFVLRTDLNEGDDDTLTWQDLVGYTIRDAETSVIGEIDTIDESTINTLATSLTVVCCRFMKILFWTSTPMRVCYTSIFLLPYEEVNDC